MLYYTKCHAICLSIGKSLIFQIYININTPIFVLASLDNIFHIIITKILTLYVAYYLWYSILVILFPQLINIKIIKLDHNVNVYSISLFHTYENLLIPKLATNEKRNMQFELGFIISSLKCFWKVCESYFSFSKRFIATIS